MSLLLSPSTGTLVIFCGTGVWGYQDGSCTTARFASPRGVAVVGQMLYVMDTGNLLLRAINMTSSEFATKAHCDACVCVFVYFKHVSTFPSMCFTEAVAAVAGSTNEAWVDGVGLSASFSQPYSLTPTANGTYLVVGSNSGIIRAVRLSDCTFDPLSLVQW
ncbi:MAG: hypothetical protein P4L40_24740 [Terracidiphilus sp.]|nr:hypothetical protein [Terracidiphilus sp.]